MAAQFKAQGATAITPELAMASILILCLQSSLKKNILTSILHFKIPGIAAISVRHLGHTHAC